MTEETLENKRSLSIIAGGVFDMDWMADNNRHWQTNIKHTEQLERNLEHDQANEIDDEDVEAYSDI